MVMADAEYSSPSADHEFIGPEATQHRKGGPSGLGLQVVLNSKIGGSILPLHVFVRFEPLPGKQRQLHDELILILEPTRAEPGCIRIHLYESTRDPLAFFIHSEWITKLPSIPMRISLT
jgi:hypothetical protein